MIIWEGTRIKVEKKIRTKEVSPGSWTRTLTIIRGMMRKGGKK